MPTVPSHLHGAHTPVRSGVREGGRPQEARGLCLGWELTRNRTWAAFAHPAGSPTCTMAAHTGRERDETER